MKTKLLFLKAILLPTILLNMALAEPPKENTISLFGTKPIQLEIGMDGIKQNKNPGYICELNASLGGGHYSEWGQTEEDARSLVTKKCSSESGVLLCKRGNAICKQEK